MLGLSVLVVGRFGLEAPGVVASVEAGEEAGVGQFDETAVKRRFVVALGHERVGHVGMADGIARGGDVLQNGHAGRGGPQAGGANAVAGGFDSDGDRFAVHGFIIAGGRVAGRRFWASGGETETLNWVENVSGRFL